MNWISRRRISLQPEALGDDVERVLERVVLLRLVPAEVVLLQEVQLEDLVQPALELVRRTHERLSVSGENGLRLPAAREGRGPELPVDGDDRAEHGADERDQGDHDTGVHQASVSLPRCG
jgi:hypothetical protein